MLFVTLCTARPGVSEDSMRRRLEWRPPKGTKIVGEYWLPTSDPRVVIAMESDDPSQIFEGQMGWDDVYEMKTYPAVTGEVGLQMVRTLLGERTKAAPTAPAAASSRIPAGV